MARLVRRITRITGLVILAAAVLSIALVTYVLLVWNRPVSRPVVTLHAPRDEAHVHRGEYLYNQSLLCWDCHGSRGSRSAAEPQAGGREFDLTGIGPGFGYVYGTNLTTDFETGIGAWSDGELVRAIREGVRRDGRVIFPVMAYQFYHGLGDDDALSLVAYLRTLPPVRNPVAPKRLSFAAKAMQAIGLIEPEPAITQPVTAPSRATSVEYGEYVAWRTSGCAECHTPRDPRTARVDRTRPLAGGLFPFPEPEFTTTGPNLTPDESTGIGSWTEEQFVRAVQGGVRPNGTVMLPFMPWPSYSRWDREEVLAVWMYLRSLKPIAHRVPPTTLTVPAANATGPRRGAAIFDAYCVTCHGVRGAGGPFTSAPLRDIVGGLDDSTLVEVIMQGMPGTLMPPFGKTLTKDQVADLAAHLRVW
jgi:mono/diheme cytochrome c family protein